MVVARASVLRCHLHRTSARLLEPLLAERHVVGPRYFLRVHRHATTHSEQCRRAWTSAPDPPCQEVCPAPAVRPSSAWPARTSFAHDTGAPLVHAQPARPPCSRGRRRPRTDPLLEACVRRQQECVLDAAPAPRVSSCPVATSHTTNHQRVNSPEATHRGRQRRRTMKQSSASGTEQPASALLAATCRLVHTMRCSMVPSLAFPRASFGVPGTSAAVVVSAAAAAPPPASRLVATARGSGKGLNNPSRVSR